MTEDTTPNHEENRKEGGGQAQPPNPFDPGQLRLSHFFGEELVIKKRVVHIPVMKPNKGVFFRVHPDDEYRLDTFLLDVESDKKIYLVNRSLWQGLQAEPLFKPRKLVTCVTNSEAPFLWALKMPSGNAGSNSWTESALEIARIAENEWVRLDSNSSAGMYQSRVADGYNKEPVWPELTFREILEIAFRTALIDSEDHPVLRRLRGEI